MEFPKNLSNIKLIAKDENVFYKCRNRKQIPEEYSKLAIIDVYGLKKFYEIAEEYHRSLKTLENIYNEFSRLQPDKIIRSQCKFYEKALLDLVDNINTKEKFKVIDTEGTTFIPQNSTASAELPYIKDEKFICYIVKRYIKGEIENTAYTKGNGMPYIIKNEKKHIEEIMKGIKAYKDTSHTRVHCKSPVVKKNINKIRLVAGTPYRTILIEMMLIHPLVMHLQKNKNAIGWGYETFKGGLCKLKDEFKSFSSFINLDFSAFDKRVPHWFIEDIHKTWQSICCLDQYYLHSKNNNLFVDPSEVKNLWKYMTEAATKERLIMPDGHIFERLHSGFGSGMYQTQLLGSHINYVMIVSAMLNAGFERKDFEIKVLGDDSVIAMNYDGNLDQLLLKMTEYIEKNFNALVNKEKSRCYVGVENIQFLSYKIKNGEVCRVKEDLLPRLIYPEKNRYDKETTKTRALGIMVANFGVNLKIHEVCTNIISMLDDVKANENLIPNYDRFRLQALFKNTTKEIPSIEELKFMANSYSSEIDNIYNFDDIFK
ncbi:hypothetical protein GVAV_002936 [Gurleya vavrai]